ncbi:MAG: hypothetical protein QNK20_16285 [Aureibaculum sp.]|nr:hypothetical protein [Aureibaculum sp.]
MLSLQINTTACDGSDMFWPWILWLLGAFILGLLLGWLLRQIFGGKTDTTDYDAKINGLEVELKSCRNEKSKLTASLAAAAAAAVASTKTEPDATSLGATTIIADDSVKNDLTKVEGIGPKIKSLFNEDGIWSFVQLSEASIERLQKVLDNAGPRYRVHNPKTWAQQAKLAAEGKWDELKKWQGELKGGK